MIVWMEDDSYDLALSFQDKAGCDDLWTKICEVCKQPSAASNRHHLSSIFMKKFVLMKF